MIFVTFKGVTWGNAEGHVPHWTLPIGALPNYGAHVCLNPQPIGLDMDRPRPLTHCRAAGHDLSAPRGLLRSGECAECARIYNRRSRAKRQLELTELRELRKRIQEGGF